MDQNLLGLIIEAVKGTPIWVWGILAYILYVGFKSTRNTVVYLPIFTIMPIILLFLQFRISPVNINLSFYAAFPIMGSLMGIIIAYKTPIKILKKIKSIEVSGNHSTLIILILIFLIKYFFGYMQKTQQENLNLYLLYDAYITILSFGYFSGKSLYYVYKFYSEKENFT